MITIPQQLNGWCFIKLKPRDKIPIELKWTTTATYGYSDSGLLAHIEAGGNYGVLGSEDHVIVDGDTPEVQQAMDGHLPLTFTVRTPGHQGRHYYFLCKLEKPIRLRDKNKVNVGDVQGLGKQVVGPNCIHPNGKTYEVVNDRPPNWIAPDDLKRALKEFIVKEPPSAKFAEGERKALVGEGLKADIKITDVHPPEGMIRRGDEYYGSHPVHGSEGGQNFWINTKKNVWTCFRHDTGGGPLSLLAVKEGIIKCEEATKRVLRGEKFKRALELARARGMLKQAEDPRLLYFNEKGVFVPKLLADAITKDNHFATHRESWTIYHYDRGAYRPDGRVEIRELARKYLGERGRDHYITEAEKHIQDTNFKRPEEFEPAPELLCVKNGILNTVTRELKPHTPTIIFLSKLATEYNPAAKCPTILTRLYEWTGGNMKDLIKLIQFAGFCLYRDYFIRKAIIIHGEGNNGKTTFVIFMIRWLGTDSVASVKVQKLEKRFTAARLFGKLANLCDDLPGDEWFSTGSFKQATGGSPLEAEKKFKDEFLFCSYAKMLFTGNRMPVVSDDTLAFWDRIALISFGQQFSGVRIKNREDLLKEMLTDGERSGFLNLALEGLASLLSVNEFFAMEDTEETKRKYIKISDPTMAFAHELTMNDPEANTPKRVIYTSYVEYCRGKGFPIKENNAFARSFKRIYPNIEDSEFVDEEGRRHHSWRGVALKPLDEGENPEKIDNSPQVSHDSHVSLLYQSIIDQIGNGHPYSIPYDIDIGEYPAKPTKPVEGSK